MGAGTWCKRDGRTRSGADSCTKSERQDLKKARKLGAKETERQGLERMHAPSQMRGDGEWHQTWCKLLIEECFLVPDVHVGRELIFIISRNHELICHPE